jgi:hypothetical protein
LADIEIRPESLVVAGQASIREFDCSTIFDASESIG